MGRIFNNLGKKLFEIPFETNFGERFWELWGTALGILGGAALGNLGSSFGNRSNCEKKLCTGILTNNFEEPQLWETTLTTNFFKYDFVKKIMIN